VACWSTKGGISLKHVKIEEKLLWRAYRNSPTLVWTVPSPTPYSLLFPKVGGSQPPPKTSITIISGSGKATDFKFGRYIHTVHPNKSPLKYLEKRERERIQGLPKFFGVPPIISGTGKAMNVNFCTHIYWLSRNKSPLQISSKVAVGIVRDSRKCSEHPYIGRIARSSLGQLSFLVTIWAIFLRLQSLLSVNEAMSSTIRTRLRSWIN